MNVYPSCSFVGVFMCCDVRLLEGGASEELAMRLFRKEAVGHLEAWGDWTMTRLMNLRPLYFEPLFLLRSNPLADQNRDLKYP